MRRAFLLGLIAWSGCGGVSALTDGPPGDARVTADLVAEPRDAATVDAERGPDLACAGVLCGGACVDTTSDAANCGACGHVCPTLTGAMVACQGGACTVDQDVSQSFLWSAPAPNPALTFWQDGTLLACGVTVGAAQNMLWNGTAIQVTGTVNNLAGRPSIYIPTKQGKTQAAITHYGAFVALDQTFTQVWSNSAFGCCGTTPYGWTIDAAQSLLLVDEFTLIDLDSGASITENKTAATPYPGKSGVYYWSVATNYVTLRSRAAPGTALQTFDTNSAKLPFDLPVALADDESLIAASSSTATLNRLEASGKSWSVTVSSPGLPVVAPGGLILLGSGNTLTAFQVSDGSVAWSTPLDGAPSDVLVAQGGIAYAGGIGSTTIVGVRISDGRIVERYRNAPPPVEMLLRSGLLYVASGNRVMAFAVTAQSYDPSAPWPVRFHDNQRTSNQGSTLAY